MNSLNRVTLMGVIGERIEKRENASFSLATYTPWQNENGDYKETIEWHAVKVFNDELFETIVPKLKKGDLVFVEGSLRTRKGVDKNGNAHHISEVIVEQEAGKILKLKDSLEAV
jgi:single-strand DNA-binding protein